MPVSNGLRLAIGGVVIHVSAVNGRTISIPEERAHIFRFSSEKEPDLTISVVTSGPSRAAELPVKREVFSNNISWSIYELEGGAIALSDASSAGERSDRLIILDIAAGIASIYYNLPEDAPNGAIVDPLSYPVEQLLMMNILARNIGLVVHSCGVSYRGAGLLFVGSSTAGKTTMANLWGENEETKILSDDRIIVRSADNAYRIYGTPWHGTGRFAKPDSAVLKRVFFLKKGFGNSLRVLAPAEAVSRMIAASFPPFWSKTGMEFTLSLCSGIFENIVPYELTFKPEGSAVDLIKESL